MDSTMAKSLRLFILLCLFTFTLNSAFGDELEGIYQDGPWTVTIRQRADGSYDVERTGKLAGKDVTQKSVAQVQNGRLLASFQGDEIQSRSMRNQLGELSGGDAQSDITVKPFELLVKDAAARRVRDLPQESRGQSSPEKSSPPAPAIVNQSLGEDSPLTPRKSEPSSSTEARVSEPSPQNPNSPFLAGLAVAAAVAAAAAAGGSGSSTDSQEKTPEGQVESRSEGPDLQLEEAKRELELLEAIAQDANDSVMWTEPQLFSEADLRAATGNNGALSPAETLVLEYTNLQILEGGADTDLARNLEQAQQWRPKLYSEGDAKALDGSNSALLSPIEAEVLRYTNQQIASGGSNVDLRANYQQFLNIYRDEVAAAEAQTIFQAIDGLGTDEEAVINTLRGKSKHQIAILNQAFANVLRQNGQSASRGDYDTVLHRWIDGDFDRGWYDKAMDAYNGRIVKEDADYFWASAAAKNWNQFIRDSDQGAKYMIEHGNLAEQGIGHLNQFIFGGAQAVNDQVSYAQQFYMERMGESESGTVRFLAKTGYVLSSIGGSFGTKALDPTLSAQETEEGLFDLALLVGTFGAGKLVQAGAKTATGARVLGQLAKNMKHLSRLSYSLKRVTGLANSSAKLTRTAKRYRDLAAATKNAKRAEQALKAAQRFEAAAARATKAEAAVSKARRLEAAAREALKAGRADDAVRLTEQAVKAAEDAKRSVEALRLAESSAKTLAREASLLNHNAAARAYDGAKARLTAPAFNNARTLRTVSAKMDDAVSADVAAQLKKIVDGRLSGNTGRMNGAQFNQLMDDLAAFAEKNGVTISRTTETVGVFPKGLYEIQLAGFGKMKNLTDTVSFAKRHELAHIVHTLQTRATIAQSLSPNGARLTGQALREAEDFLKLIEGGSNYRQFEKAVTGISSAAHLSDRAADIGLYAKRVDALIDGTQNGLHMGKMRFANGKSFEEVYALFLSKAPAVVGTGFKDLALRFPPMLFGTFYSTNIDVNYYFDPRDFGIDPGPSGRMGFRDFINRLAVEGYHPERTQ